MKLYNFVTRCMLCFIGIMHSTADNRVRKFPIEQDRFIDTGLLYRRLRLRLGYALLLLRYKVHHRQTDS